MGGYGHACCYETLTRNNDPVKNKQINERHKFTDSSSMSLTQHKLEQNHMQTYNNDIQSEKKLNDHAFPSENSGRISLK